MLAYLYPGNSELLKFREFFPDIGPGEMPLAGKPLCRHLMDLCGILKVSEVFLIDRFLNPELTENLGDGSYWSLRLHYLNTERCATLRELSGVRKKFHRKEEETLIVWGLVFPNIQTAEELFKNLCETDPDRENPESGVYLFRNGKYYRCCCPLFQCSSLKNYFDINFRLLQDPGIYSLPSYSSQRSFGIGRNVAMLPRCEVQTPVLILNDVLISRGVSVKDGAIIGQSVVIDENTKISHSIILNNTYIGRNMVFQDKIVNGRRVLDPASDSFVDLDDSFLADDFSGQRTRHMLFMPLEQLFALFLAVVELPLYLLTLIGWKFFKDMPFAKFLRTIYPRFWKAAAGRVQLVRFGSRNDYVFRYSDLWWPAEKTKYEKNMADVYYYHHRNIFRMMAIPIGSQLRRMLTLRDPQNGQ